MNQNNKLKLTTDWQFKEGVFQLPTGKWICRVKIVEKNVNFPRWTTISQHDTEQLAQTAFDTYKAQ